MCEIVPILNQGKKLYLLIFLYYRPNSLLSFFSKLLEKIVPQQMFRNLIKYHVFYEHQYGFRPGHRTEQSVMQFLSRVYNGLNKETPEYAFFYLKKAFKLCF